MLWKCCGGGSSGSTMHRSTERDEWGAPAVEFRILGPVRLHAAGRTTTVGEPRQQVVLAALLLEPGHTVGIDTLVDRVWGEDPPQQARRSLQAHIARIR